MLGQFYRLNHHFHHHAFWRTTLRNATKPVGAFDYKMASPVQIALDYDY